MNTYKWLLRREFWENRGGFFWAPVIAGIVFLVLNIGGLMVALAAAGRAHIQVGLVRFDTLVQRLDEPARALVGGSIDMSLYLVSALMGLVVAVVVFFYCLGALYDERRDRSVLFWKSLPLSDRDTVLSKVLSATLVAPVIGTIAGFLTGIALLVVIALFFAFNGQNVFGVIATTSNPFEVLGTLLAMVPIGALWALPTVGWVLLCSAWARTKPFLWAIFIPIGAGIMVSWFDLMQSVSLPDFWFWENVVARALLSVFPFTMLGSAMETKIKTMEDGGPEQLVGLFGIEDVMATLATTELWVGAAIGIAMIIVAIRLRRWRDEG